ncbi:MAG: BspA family leucine-rich repeat surface protein [Bacteroidales bacterium]|nr:BspA family leucine-rich repeat surface protein [Bacteroidales bacterium]
MYNNLNIRHFATRRGKKLYLVIFFLCFSVLSFSQAKLLIPCGKEIDPNGSVTTTDMSSPNGTADCHYLKERLSWLCPVGASGNSKYIKTFQRISKSAAAIEIAKGEGVGWVKRTCLSVSYDKDWVYPNVSDDHIEPSFPAIVYAFSTGSESDGYNVYYWVDDGIDNDPMTNDDIIKPKAVGDARNLFQGGNAGNVSPKVELLDLSGWDFSEVTNLASFVHNCQKLTFINLGTADLMNVTSIAEMFFKCNKLSNDVMSSLVNSWVVNKSKLTNKGAKASANKGLNVTTANDVKYVISSSGSFDSPTGGTTYMTLRNLDASQILGNIRFNIDVVFEKDSVERYVIVYIDEDEEWEVAVKKELISFTPTTEKPNVKTYNPVYTPANPREFDGTKKFKVKIEKNDGSIVYSEEFNLTFDGFLPIELSYFTVTQDGGNILFVWETATETNNDYFTIEQSIDGVSFHEVAQIAGAGTSSTNNYYEYSMLATFSGLMYFRLKQTDYNGDYSYSNIQAINVGNSEYIRLYPTIATDFITIEGDYESVKFSDAQGKIHHPTRMNGNSYPIAALPQGMHYAIISLKNGEIVTRHFFRK